MATKTKRLEIRAEDSFIQTLERLAREGGTTKAGVIDAAVHLLEEALEENKKGKVISYIYKEEPIHGTERTVESIH